MDHIVLVPHFGAGRGRLARDGRATVYAVADAVGNAAFASWAGLVGERPAAEVLDELARIVPRSAVSALAAFVVDGGGLEVLTVGAAPITVDGRPLSTGPSMQRQRLEGAATIELLATGQLADDPLLDFERGVVAADGFTLRRSVAGPAPWEDQAGAAQAGAAAAGAQPAAGQAGAAAQTGGDQVGGAAAQAGAAVAGAAAGGAQHVAAQPDAAAVAAGAGAAAGAAQSAPVAAAAADHGHDHHHDHHHDHGGGAAPVGLVSLLEGDDDLPDAAPLPVAGGPAPVPAAQAPPSAGAPAPAPNADAPAAPPSGPAVVRVAGLRCARDHFNDPRARFCATCGIAMHQASFVLTEDVRPALGVITFADGTFYSVTGNLVFGRDPDDDPAVRSRSATPAVLIDSQNTISRVHAEVRAIEWDVYLVDRGSTNGTFVWNASAQQWDRLVPDQPRAIEPGAQISFGRLVAAFDSGLRP